MSGPVYDQVSHNGTWNVTVRSEFHNGIYFQHDFEKAFKGKCCIEGKDLFAWVILSTKPNPQRNQPTVYDSRSYFPGYVSPSLSRSAFGPVFMKPAVGAVVPCAPPQDPNCPPPTSAPRYGGFQSGGILRVDHELTLEPVATPTITNDRGEIWVLVDVPGRKFGVGTQLPVKQPLGEPTTTLIRNADGTVAINPNAITATGEEQVYGVPFPDQVYDGWKIVYGAKPHQMNLIDAIQKHEVIWGNPDAYNVYIANFAQFACMRMTGTQINEVSCGPVYHDFCAKYPGDSRCACITSTRNPNNLYAVQSMPPECWTDECVTRPDVFRTSVCRHAPGEVCQRLGKCSRKNQIVKNSVMYRTCNGTDATRSCENSGSVYQKPTLAVTNGQPVTGCNYKHSSGVVDLTVNDTTPGVVSTGPRIPDVPDSYYAPTSLPSVNPRPQPANAPAPIQAEYIIPRGPTSDSTVVWIIIIVIIILLILGVAFWLFRKK